MKNFTAFVALPILALTTAAKAPAQGQTDPDKSQYSLFNPVPAELLRDLTGDRPDGTESATTVDAGHIQIEASFVDYSRDRNSDTAIETITAGATNVRVGLLSNFELQLVVDVFAREEAKIAGFPKEITDGFSDVTLRPKLNLWGNDRGTTALAVMPAVKIVDLADVLLGIPAERVGCPVAEWGLSHRLRRANR